MTPEQIRLVEGIVADVGDSTRFAQRFYERLFATAPEVASMFSDVEAQQRKLTDELAAMVSLLQDLPSLDQRARDLGERHRGYGVRAGHYRVARETMAATLSDVLGDRFGDAEAEAWDRATSLISELMQTR